jgi:hypothetical protein
VFTKRKAELNFDGKLRNSWLRKREDGTFLIAKICGYVSSVRLLPRKCS